MVGTSTRVLRLAAFFTVWLLMAALVPIAASAQEEESPPPKEAPAEIPGEDIDGGDGQDHGEPVDKPDGDEVVATVEPPTCDLTDGDSEFAHCVSVDASLDSAPELGGSAVLTVTVNTSDAFAGVSVEVVGTDGVVAIAGGAAADKGPIDPAAAKVLTYTVDAVGVGEAVITARASVDIGGGDTDGQLAEVYLTVAGAGGGSSFGIDGSAEGGVAEAVGPIAPAALPEDLVDRAAGIEDEVVNDDPTGVGGAAATSCISGRWGWTDAVTGYTGVGNYQVQIWDDDVVSADDLLVQGVTSGNGNYNLCYNETDGEGSAAQEVYVRFISANSEWRVRNTAASNNNYVNTTGVIVVPDGANQSFGSLLPGNNIHRGIDAFNAINKLWLWGAGGNGCFDWTGPCRQMVINWTNTSTDGTYYSLGGNDVHLAAADPDSEHLVIHEGTHAVMDDVYNDAYPAAPSCNPHSVQGASSTGCAWSEGFAEWVPASVLNDPFFRWPNGASLDLENRSWLAAGWDDGPDVEGRVAGAMIDISDFATAALDYWDFYGEGDPSNQWRTFQDWETVGNGAVPGTYADFWQDRAQKGYNVVDEGAEGANYQNTIDNAFRDTLFPYVTRALPDPTDGNGTGHNYRLRNDGATNGAYWSVVAIRPEAGSDRDLRYYEDFAQTTNLVSSIYGGSVIDFVAVDHNHRATSWDYPRVIDFLGDGGYEIEWAAAQQTVSQGVTNIFMGSTDVVQVRDLFTSELGNGMTVRAVPPGGQDIELHLMDSDPANAATHVRSRSGAVRNSDVGGAGVVETIDAYLPAASDWSGLVLLNKGGSGTTTLYIDASAPTGSVVIDGGATTTTSSDVSLALSASDAQTGIDAMRVCPDGLCDSEPWEPFAAAKNVTLPAGLGLKTVAVQYRNGAYLVSDHSDSITVLAEMCDGQVATHVGTDANNVLNGTPGDDVFVAKGGNDTINGNGGNDTVCAGTGNDIIDLGPGDDRVFGEDGDDDIRSRGGADYIEGGDGDDTIRSGSGADEVHAGDGLDEIIAGQGPDRIYGDAGVDSLNGGAGDDVVEGGTGNDALRGQGADDEFQGDDGDDIIRGHAGDDILRGAGGDDTLLASNGDDQLYGGPQDDTLWAGAGADFLNGGTGLNDFCHGGTDNDVDTDINCEVRMKLP